VGWRVTYLGADTPASMIAEAADAVKPRLTVVAAVMPGSLDGAMDELAAFARRRLLAVAGAGTSPELGARLGARHLAADPVSAAGEILE
jgi:methanogenic corrinoid protein MtbC1